MGWKTGQVIGYPVAILEHGTEQGSRERAGRRADLPLPLLLPFRLPLTDAVAAAGSSFLRSRAVSGDVRPMCTTQSERASEDKRGEADRKKSE